MSQSLFYKFHKKSAINRTLIELAMTIPRTSKRLFATSSDYLDNPPVIGNSFPKSGTHLQWQILAGITEGLPFGNFISTHIRPSLRQRTPEQMSRLIKKLTPGESVGAHIFYSPEADEAIRASNAVHYYIYRDPRDVIVSEAHFLATMAKFHALHKYISGLPDLETRITALTKGVTKEEAGSDYPNIRQRFEWYTPWLSNDNVLPVRFEDLRGDRQQETIGKIVDFYMDRTRNPVPRDILLERAQRAIAPEKSHTFRSGKTEAWRHSMSNENKELVKEIAGDLLIELGYETDKDW